MEVILYGIANCDTIRKAKKWLDNAEITYQYHDYRKHGLSKTQLDIFVSELGWENLINKRGTTFRQLDATTKQSLNADSAVSLMLNAPAMIKRPLLSIDGHFYLGFKPEDYQTIFQQG
ncbi:ArsC family reductase [Thaumasiovibrio sp. DFM-14]|uniref:ArsC family reductase n=1 Tax=Thaumasiovibrio sp. DFM-14 TaxID=3384792 RepID=UPI0039A12352